MNGENDMAMNQAHLIGRLTGDPTISKTNSGARYSKFTLAVTKNYANQQGAYEANFIRCVIWSKQAENFVKFTHKGALVGIEGSIETGSYENKQGQKVYTTEILVSNFTPTETKEQSEAAREQPNSTANPSNDPNWPYSY